MKPIAQANATRCADCALHAACMGAELSGCISQLQLKRGQHLYRPGDDADSFYVVRDGALKTYVDSSDGAEQILAFHGQGDLVGFEGASGEESGRSGAVALGAASVCRIPASRVMQAMGSSSALRQRLMQGMGGEIQRLQRMLRLERCTAEQRIATFLLSQLRKAQRSDRTQRTLQLPMSRVEIGRFLDLATETVSRMFTSLQRRGVLALEGTAVSVLNIEGLVAAAQGQPGLGSAYIVKRGATQRLAPAQIPMRRPELAQVLH